MIMMAQYHEIKSLLIIGILTFMSSKCSSTPLGTSAQGPKALFQDPHVFLTVSPESGYRVTTTTPLALLDRMLEVNWENFQNMPNDKIGVYDENPNNEGVKPLEEFTVNGASGKFKTNTRYERRSLNASMESCIGFWVAYTRNENGQTNLIESNCLKVYPKWMNGLKNEISKVPLHSLMIPGTHNAGSWIYYEGLPSEGVVIKYTYCHDDSIYEQLIHGIRSFDVRVGHYPNTDEKFYINHDVVRIRPLKTLLEDVRKFVLETNEIVLLDFHRFPVGFDGPEVHRDLVAFVEEELGDLLAPKSLTLSVTPEKLWELKKTVVLFYIDGATVSEYDKLWPGVNQAWGDTNQLPQLEEYLGNAMSEFGCKQQAWSAMSQLTSTAGDIIVRPGFGIRGFANLANSQVTKWFQRESWYSKAMIVALDFYLGTNVIENAIEVNRQNANSC